ncbi:hypothetical protein OC844_003272 [Tilletia horrida]|nr:hypothetical protein OC844_003272 [Tilletia horrida]
MQTRPAPSNESESHWHKYTSCPAGCPSACCEGRLFFLQTTSNPEHGRGPSDAPDGARWTRSRSGTRIARTEAASHAHLPFLQPAATDALLAIILDALPARVREEEERSRLQTAALERIVRVWWERVADITADSGAGARTLQPGSASAAWLELTMRGRSSADVPSASSRSRSSISSSSALRLLGWITSAVESNANNASISSSFIPSSGRRSEAFRPLAREELRAHACDA